MQIAIAEMLTFPIIPVSVTINEYVDLAKLYSTPRSGGYVNGMLDAIARFLITSGKMLKEMPEPRPRRQPEEQQRPVNRVRFVHRPRINEAPASTEAPATPEAPEAPTTSENNE